MRRRNELIFDEVINATSSTPALTSDRFDAVLGQFDQLAIFVLVDEVSASGGGANFDLFIDHSANGKDWTWKNAPGPNGDVHIGGLSTAATNVGWGSDPGTLMNPPTPLLGFVRFRMYLSTIATAHVKVYITQRDQGG